MAHQQETQPTTKWGENSAQQPTEQENTHEKVAALFDSMFDEYVRIDRHPKSEILYKIGETEEQYGANEGGEVVLLKKAEPIYEAQPKVDILASQRHEIELYIKFSVVNEGRKFNPELLLSEGPATFDEITDAIFREEIGKAEQRLDNPVKTEYPAHISVESNDTDPESTNKFIDVISTALDLGASAIHAVNQAVKEGPHLFSRPTAIITAFNDQQEILKEVSSQQLPDDRDLLNDPEHAPEVTQNIHTVTPEDLRIKV
jgi:hypothetical protein